MPTTLLGQKIKTFNLIQKLGEGAFAVVFKGVDESTGRVVAAKVMKMSELKKSKKISQLVKTQIAVLKSCKNDNVIGYVDSFQTQQFLFIVTQFCNGGDLQNYLAIKGTLTQDEAVVYLKQILNGFLGLHEVGAMHRDFKVANVLLHDNVCKIADLGFAKQMEQNAITKTCLGTSLTMAPQVLDYRPYGFEADIWSIGVVFYQLLYGKFPYNGKSDAQLLHNIRSSRPSYEGINISKEAKDFIQRCLTVDSKARISWKQIYEHPLIASSFEGKMIASKGLNRNAAKDAKNFYQTVKLDDERQNLMKTYAKELVVEVVPTKNFQQIKDVQKLKMAVDQQKQKQIAFHNMSEYYINKRNDIMFVNKFIEPHVKTFSKTRVNHSTVLFIFSKKAYLELKKLSSEMTSKKNVFKNSLNPQSRFEQFSTSENYSKITSQVQQDIDTMSRLCQKYKSTIKISSLDVQNQFDMKKGQIEKLNIMLNQLLGEYTGLLAKSLDDENKQNRSSMVKVIQALLYYRNNPRPYSHQFDRILSTTDLVEAEKSLRKQYNIR